MVTGPAPLEEEEEEVPTFCPPEKETLQKSMTLMRHLLVDAQVQELLFSTAEKHASVIFLPRDKPCFLPAWTGCAEKPIYFQPFLLCSLYDRSSICCADQEAEGNTVAPGTLKVEKPV